MGYRDKYGSEKQVWIPDFIAKYVPANKVDVFYKELDKWSGRPIRTGTYCEGVLFMMLDQANEL